MTAGTRSRASCPKSSATSDSTMPATHWPGISPAFRGTSWSRPRGSSRVTWEQTFRWPSTGCSRHRRSGFSASEQHRYETLSIAALTREDRNAPAIAPAQYHDVDVGEGAPVKCLNNGLWLCQTDGLRYAVVLSSHREYGYEAGTRIEIAVPAGADGAEFVQRCFSELESAVNAARCYRGKVLSLDGDADYRGRTRGVMVHKLPSVQREDVIRPEARVKLLDRNVLKFV